MPSTSLLLSHTEFPPLPTTTKTSNLHNASHYMYMSTAVSIKPHSTFWDRPSNKTVPIPRQSPPTTVPQSPPTKDISFSCQSPPTTVLQSMATSSSHQPPPNTVVQSKATSSSHQHPRQDVRNIKVQYNVDGIRQHRDDPASVNA